MDSGSWEVGTQVHRKVSNASGSLLRGPDLRLGLAPQQPMVCGDLWLFGPQGTTLITAALG